MTNYKNDLPPYAEQITLNQEVEHIQQILNQFKQPIPDKFVEVETDYIFTTKSKWSKPLSERYSFEYQGEWFQIDIPHTLMESLELEKGKDIPYPVHLDPKVLKKASTCGGITIENDKEIFLQKPFTIDNLEEDINKLFEIIANLEKGLEKEIQSFTHELKGEKQLGQSQKKFYQQKIQYLRDQLNQIQNERDALPALPTFADYQLLQNERDNLQTTITQSQTRLGINDLNNLPVLPQGETLTSLLARPTQIQLNEKDQELTTKNTQIANLTSQLNSLQINYNNLNNELTTTKRELDKEKDWWNKWEGIGNGLFGYRSSSCCTWQLVEICFPKQKRSIGDYKYHKENFAKDFKRYIYEYHRDN